MPALQKNSKRGRACGAFLRRAPFLVSYWQDKQLYLENYLSRKKIAASMETLVLLDFFSGWKREEEMFRRWPQYTQKSLRHAAERLVNESFLHKSSKRTSKQSQAERALKHWKNWNPAAGFFHFQTKDSYSEEVRPEEIQWVKNLMQREPIPAPVKRCSSTQTIPLTRETCNGEFPEVLLKRRTWREFGNKPVSKDQLARVLHLSFGVQGWGKISSSRSFALKTSPSGGGLHPAEAYVLVRKVTSVPRGVYHYDAVGHRLQQIGKGVSSAHIQTLLAGQWWFRGAAFVVFLTAIFHRTQWKYDYARAYRAVLAETGHLCQTFCLTATWLGLAPFCTMALTDTKIERILRVDGISESVLYAMGAGTKPERPNRKSKVKNSQGRAHAET
jgi:SagB-type dehydrogenase family enzyme